MIEPAWLFIIGTVLGVAWGLMVGIIWERDRPRPGIYHRAKHDSLPFMIDELESKN